MKAPQTVYEIPHASVWLSRLEPLVELLFPMPCLACDALADHGLRGLGHWVQQEAPDATNAALDR